MNKNEAPPMNEIETVLLIGPEELKLNIVSEKKNTRAVKY